MKFEELTKDMVINNRDGLDAFTGNMGIIVRSVEEHQAVAELKLSECLNNPIGSVHGGAIFTLADIAAGLAATSDGTKATTLDSNIRFLKAAFFGKTEYLRATATLKKVGKKVRVAEVEVTDDAGELICLATFGFFAI